MDPLKNWQNWRKNLDSFFSDEIIDNFNGLFQYNSFPQVNMYETENEVICIANIPGLEDINSVDVYVDHRSVELKGFVNLRYKGYTLTKDELYHGHFDRKIDLPFPVKDDRIQATYRNGLLVIHLHRLIPLDQYRQKIDIKKMDD